MRSRKRSHPVTTSATLYAISTTKEYKRILLSRPRAQRKSHRARATSNGQTTYDVVLLATCNEKSYPVSAPLSGSDRNICLGFIMTSCTLETLDWNRELWRQGWQFSTHGLTDRTIRNNIMWSGSPVQSIGPRHGWRVRSRSRADHGRYCHHPYSTGYCYRCILRTVFKLADVTTKLIQTG